MRFAVMQPLTVTSPYEKCRVRKFIEQKLMGLALIALTALIFWMASTGTSFEDRDATMALLTAPMGLYLLFTRHIVIV